MNLQMLKLYQVKTRSLQRCVALVRSLRSVTVKCWNFEAADYDTK